MERRWRTSKYFNPRSREGSDFFRDPFTFPSSNFNPRSREGSDSLLAFSAAFSSYFNPRSREGSDRANIGSNTRRTEFQSTLPRGERQILPTRLQHDRTISIHAPARGATGISSPLICSTILFQSTLPRGERLFILSRSASKVKISIHAPARGATEELMRLHWCLTISIHAPARGATKYEGRGGSIFDDFNPRSREGSDCCSPL